MIIKPKLTDDQILELMPGGLIDCFNDPWDSGVGDNDETRSIKDDIIRVARVIENYYGVGKMNR